jgi:hypothetical protein
VVVRLRPRCCRGFDFVRGRLLWNVGTSNNKPSRKVRLRPKHDRFRWGRNDPHLPAGSFLPVGRTSFTTLGTKDCILLTAQNDRCDVFATARNKPGGGAIRKRVHRSVSPIPARKSCSSQSQVNDLTKQNYENEIRITIAIIARCCRSQHSHKHRLRRHSRRNRRTHQECQGITNRECRVITKKVPRFRSRISVWTHRRCQLS